MRTEAEQAAAKKVTPEEATAKAREAEAQLEQEKRSRAEREKEASAKKRLALLRKYLPEQYPPEAAT